MLKNDFSAINPPDNVAKIKAVARLSDVMGEHIQLRKNGSNYTCCCPFHDDKNPSMNIDDEKGFFYCFGCGESGDVFSFLQKFLGIDFKTALKELADRYGIELSMRQAAPKQVQNDALIILQERFVAELAKNAQALRYLAERGLSRQSIAEFGIGYAPSNAQSLQLLQNSQISEQTAIAQGALKRKDSGEVYASFIERITFPISDANGALIGFGARTLNANNPAKYVNSPACKLFDKKRVLYGYFAAKTAMRKAKMLLICEGYMDVIAFHQSGVKHAVAALGVALGSEHLPLIPKDTFVRLCFDSDSAGQNAAYKAAVLLARAGYNGDVISLKPYKDAGEFIQRKEGDKLAAAAAVSGENIIAFAMDYIYKSQLNACDFAQTHAADPFLKREAAAAVLDFANSLDIFLAQSHLKLFAARAQLEFSELLNASARPAGAANHNAANSQFPYNGEFSEKEAVLGKLVARSPVRAAATKAVEAAALRFCAMHRTDFSEVLHPEYFAAREVAEALAAGEFDAFCVAEWLQNHPGEGGNIALFMDNLARLYAFSASGMRQKLLQEFATSVRANEARLLANAHTLARAYSLLARLAEPLESSALVNLAAEINQLGEL